MKRQRRNEEKHICADSCYSLLFSNALNGLMLSQYIVSNTLEATGKFNELREALESILLQFQIPLRSDALRTNENGSRSIHEHEYLRVVSFV